MSNCESVRDHLVLYAEGELTANESQRIREHLAACNRCRDEAGKIETLRAYLADPNLFLPENYAWNLLPRSLAARAMENSSVRRWAPSNLGSAGWVATLAASLMLACGLIWLLHRQIPAPPPASSVKARGNEAFIKQMQTVHAREATARYLVDCQDLLLNVVRAEKNCEGDKHDVSLEVARARELIQRKRMLDSELRVPEVARAKELCDELETFLVSLSTSEKCESSDQLHILEGYVEKEQLLLRINLLQSELS